MKIYMRAYLYENLGDDLFVNILTERYSKHKFYAITCGLNEYKNNAYYKNLKIVSSNKYVFRIIRKFKLEKIIANRLDLVVIIGGSMYIEANEQDKEREFTIGKNKHYIIGTNFGPCTTDEYLNRVKKSFENAEDVCFRESYSYNLFKDINHVRFASDIIFSVDTSKIKKIDSKKVIISVVLCRRKSKIEYEEAYETKIIEMTKFFMNKGYEVTLMSFCKSEGDELAIQNILEKCDEELKNKINTYFYRGDIDEAMNVMADSQIIVGTRFHANIIGMVLGKTVIPITYSKKTNNVLEDMNFKGKIIDLSKIDEFDIEKLSDETLRYKIDINKQKEDANRHFEKLDEVLK